MAAGCEGCPGAPTEEVSADEGLEDLRARVEYLEALVARIARVAPAVVEQAHGAPDLDHLGYGGRAVADDDPWGVSLAVIDAVKREWERRGVPLPELERHMRTPQHSTTNIARMAGRAMQELLGFPI